MTFKQRRINVDATSWRGIDVNAALYNRHVPLGNHYTYDTALQQPHFDLTLQLRRIRRRCNIGLLHR